eukprot:COSAG06_NODE_741_length_12661_cov_24.506607_2_plen_179_part_00
MASISMQQTDRGVNVENVVVYPVNAAFTDGETWDSIFPHIDTTTETIHAATCEHGEGSCNGGGSCHINDEGHCVGVRGDGLFNQPCTFVPGLAFNGQGRHEFAGGQDFEELIQVRDPFFSFPDRCAFNFQNFSLLCRTCCTTQAARRCELRSEQRRATRWTHSANPPRRMKKPTTTTR